MGDTTYLTKNGVLHTYHKKKTEIKRAVRKTLSDAVGKVSKAVEAIIGKRGKPDDIETAVRKVNKFHFYTNDKGYQINCQRCVPAYEMRRRGFDVEALPNRGEHASFTQFLDTPVDDYANYVTNSTGPGYAGCIQYSGGRTNNPNKMGRGAIGATKSIFSAMTKWGEGSRAALFIKWAGASSAHVISVENHKGQIMLVDPQVGEIVRGRENIQAYMKRTVAANSVLIRMDNRKFQENKLEELKKIMKKKGK